VEFSNSHNAGRNVYKEVAIVWKNKEKSVDCGGEFSLSLIKHVTLQKIVAHDVQYDPRIIYQLFIALNLTETQFAYTYVNFELHKAYNSRNCTL
jgi:hypothetical protein